METPLSTRRITRSLAAREKNADPLPRAALHDITNDSPIVGLADTTPASTAAKTRRRAATRRTPGSGSGEALLRGQVKALLQKVHEDHAVSRPASRIHALLDVARSPAQLLAPTPANTPQVSISSHPLPDAAVPCVLDHHHHLLLPKLQAIAAAPSLPTPPQPEPEENLGDCQLNRALVFDDSPAKSDASNGPAVSPSSQDSSGGSCMDKSSSPEDDSSSVWSMQVYASPEKELVVVGEYTDGEEDWEDDDCFDDLCEEMSRMTVLDGEEERPGLPHFQGTHTRFIYNSDDEIEREEVVDAAEARAELDALVLRGLPVPEGRHLRFHEDDEE